ncbi:hypothetical protein [Lysinibacillus xylanilyticus]|uniref:Uncharacterized protein n=1 Tax=Lysinibacillus xylanilyticus TaxID=582475 RepID=A0A2M9Q749_9BACI|nr:hypothetical protein [Lysinibacillus xylanilyticus]PJO43910.1 hypothetical protein CWD94_09975 [Lysinibacillus xylanilyticus]
MSRYNHQKHKDLPGDVRGILMNQTSDRPISQGDASEDKTPKERSCVRDIDRKILVAINGMLSLPDEHVLTFNSIWFGLVEQIGDFSRKKNIDEKTKVLLEKIMNSDVYLNETEITSRKDISDRIKALEEFTKEYLD